MMTKEQLTELVKEVNGKRRQRTISDSDIQDFFDILEANPTAKTVRVYPRDGFVANRYKYRAEVVCLCAVQPDKAGWTIYALVVDAHRSYGGQSRITINGKGQG